MGATECVPHPAQAPYLTHACALDTQVVPSTFRGCCSSEREQQREAACQADRRRRGWRQQRRRGRRQQRGWAAATGEGGPTTGGGAACTARVCDAGGSDTVLWDVNLNPNARGPADHEHLGQSPAFSPLSPLSLSLLDAGRSRADLLSGVRVALIGRDRPSTSHLLLRRGHVGQHLMTCRL